MSVRDTFKAFKKAIKSYETEGTNSALELAFFDVKDRILEDVETRIERLEELEKTQTGREYASTRFLEIVGTNIKDQGGFRGNADATETVSFTIADRAQSIIDAATEFEKQAAILDKDIKLHRRETAVIQGEALTNKEWKTWIDKRAKELGMGPRIFWQPASLAMDVNELQQRLKETVAEVNKEKETAKGLVSEAIQLRNFEDRLIKVVDNGVQPVQIFDVLSDKTKTEVQQRIERGMKNSKSEISDAPPALQLIFRGINDSPAIPADEGMRREPLPGELDRDDLVSGADDLTESERIREGLDTVVKPEEMVSEDLNFDAEDQREQFRMQQRQGEPVIDPDPDPDPDPDLNGQNDGSNDGGGGGNQDTLSDSAVEYIRENFGSVAFFQNFHGDKMWIDTDGDGTLDTNVIDKIIGDQEENPDVIWGLFQRTQWFQENGPTARQFQMDWAKAAGSLATDWSPSFNPNAGINEQWNMNAGMKELLDDTYDGLILEANRLGINTDKTETKNAIMQMAYNAKQLNMTEYELKNEFLINTNLAFNPTAVQGSSTFNAIKQKIKQDASVYMLKLDDTSINDFANKIYLGKTTYEGLNAMHAQKASEDNPALKSLIDQGYTPSAYFSSYSNVASNLLGRPIDFMGADNKMFGALTDTMVGENNLGRPMTRGEFERYVRATPEWDTSENARDEAYGTVDTLLNSFGIRV